VKILSISEFGLTILEPFEPSERLAFWAMAIRARIISVALTAAVVTLLEMAAENGGPTDLYRGHDVSSMVRPRFKAGFFFIGST
jgi:hypothetical protein